MFIELHILQNFAPSNLNRDDTGNPKDAEFGGVRRARISSQAFKRAIRQHPVFEKVTGVEPSRLTKRLSTVLFEQVKRLVPDISSDAKVVTREFAMVFSSKKGQMDAKAPDQTTTLIFLSRAEISQIANELAKLPFSQIVDEIRSLDQSLEEKKIKPEQRVSKSPLKRMADQWAKRLKGRTDAPDIALYGRMLADRPEINLDAACQVAHAISTHRVYMDFDFFTAVDDLSTGKESAHIGITSFNSATYYRYARIDWEQLVQNLDGDVALARRTVEGFLRAALRAIPTGKQNAFAAQNPPDFALAVVREDGMAWSLVNAFETPVRPSRDGGLVKPSMQALDAYWGRLTEVYGEKGVTPVAFSVPEPDGVLENLKGALQPNMETWLQKVMERLPASPEEV